MVLSGRGREPTAIASLDLLPGISALPLPTFLTFSPPPTALAFRPSDRPSLKKLNTSRMTTYGAGRNENAKRPQQRRNIIGEDPVESKQLSRAGPGGRGNRVGRQKSPGCQAWQPGRTATGSRQSTRSVLLRSASERSTSWFGQHGKSVEKNRQGSAALSPFGSISTSERFWK